MSLTYDLSGPIHKPSVRFEEFGGETLGGEAHPGVLRCRDGADDEITGRFTEGNGEEDHVAGSGGDHRRDRSNDAAVAGADGRARVRGAGGQAKGEGELPAGSAGDGRRSTA